MARTSRNGAPATNVDALDNIDLDDMFADSGDDLFDGLDIDLDMDEITGGDQPDTQEKPAALPQQQASPAANDEAAREKTRPAVEATAASTRTRRKTKRKSKTPAFFEDEDFDDEYDGPPPKKKKKGKATASNKKKNTKKTQETKASTAKGKSKNAKATTAAASATAAAARGTSSGTAVAAAGQFGGRSKRGAGSLATTQQSKSSKAKQPAKASESRKGKATISAPATTKHAAAPPAPPPPAVSAKANLAQMQAKLAQNSFCGIRPGNKLFYPFMPSLPTEPTIRSRKVYGDVDRIHSSFTNHLHTPIEDASGLKPAKETDPIFQLVQESFKESKPPAGAAPTQPPSQSTARAKTIGNAIGAVRKTISKLDKVKIAGDWYAVCALLQKQHDFLKQNAANMERWCKENFSEKDYAEVYLPPKEQVPSEDLKRKRDVLASFGSQEVKVRIVFSGFRAPKSASGPLPALLPFRFASEDEKAKATAKPKAKKRKTAADTSLPATKLPTTVASEVKLKAPPPPPSYAQMNPARRRKNVSEMICRTARELENSFKLQQYVRQQSVERNERDCKKVVDEGKVTVNHTVGMWKWLDTAGYFNALTEADVRQRLDDIRSSELDSTVDVPRDNVKGAHINSNEVALGRSGGDFMFDRLQSLLVEEEETGSDGEDYGDESNLLEEYTVSQSVDLSELTFDERACVQLRSIGLAEKFPSLPSPDVEGPAETDAMLRRNFCEAKQSTAEQVFSSQNGISRDAIQPEDVKDELKDKIMTMTEQLVRINDLNNRRASFLDAVTKPSQLSVVEEGRRRDQETTVIAKCQQVLKKAKELRAKAGTMSKKNDSLALPW